MFAYLKYFSIISFLFVLIAAFFVGMYFRSVVANGIIKANVEKNNIALTDFFIKNVWQDKRALFETLKNTDVRSWRQNPDFINFARQASAYAQTMPVVKLNITTASGQKFLSSSRFEITSFDTAISKFLLSISDNVSGMKVAQGGSAYSTIIGSAKWFTQAGKPEKGTLIHSYIPIKVTTPESPAPKVEAIIEIFYDVSEPWQYIFYFQLVGTSGIIVVFTVLYSALFYTSGKAERIIEKQHEANLELSAAKAKAESESEEKSKFLANVSHELRTPLNAIIGFSEIIKNEVYGPVGNAQYKDYINDINSSGTHLLSLINDILDYSKAEASKLQVDKVEVDITKTVKTSIRLVMPRAEEANVSLVEKVPPEHIVILADAKRLKQVLLNLLSNSVKFTPEGGTVTLSAWVEEDKAYLQVKDTGIGIAPKDISKAMATFGQVDSKLSRRYEGTGLGLPLTKKLTELMGGKFDLQSELGFGTTVTISFPYTPPSVEHA